MIGRNGGPLRDALQVDALSAMALLAPAAVSACGTSAEPSSEMTTERAIEVVEYGAGDTTVVLESGLGDDWSPWQLVAPEVAEQAQVFAYSRPGYGQSEPTPERRDAEHIVEDLRAALSARLCAAVRPRGSLSGGWLSGAVRESTSR